ncbi:MAG: hydrogenase maturation protease [Acidobacteriota bacterium]|nr:hydrogenase maturation protease [Acidobacteriota bacterium]
MARRQSRPSSGTSEPARLLIVGLGNPLMADDGIGHAVVEDLKRNGAPAGARLETLAGDVLGLADLWAGEPKIWLVDAVSGSSPPGSIRVFEHQVLLALPAEGLSAHHLSMGESLRWLLHGTPEMAAVGFTLYGIEIGALRPTPGLSPVVRRASARLASMLVGAAA